MATIWEMLTPAQRRLLRERFGLSADYDAPGERPVPIMEDADEIDRLMRQPPREGKR